MSDEQLDIGADLTFDVPGLAAHMPMLRRPEFAHALFDLPALPALVAALRGIPDPDALLAIAGDPNQPPDRLATLAALVPAVVCGNPVFPLLLFENPNLPAEMPAVALGRLLALPELPADFAAAVASFGPPELAQAARMHVSLAGEAGEAWGDELRAAVELLPVIPGDDLLLALALLGSVPAWLRPRLERGGPALLMALRGEPPPSETPGARLPAPLPAGTPEAELRRLADDERAAARAAAALCPTAPPALLAELKEQEDRFDVDYTVYAALATNPATPPATLLALARDQTALATNVRRALARNPATPPEALALLVDEPYAADVRLTLAAHPALDQSLRRQMFAGSLHQALYSGDPVYRAVALGAPGCPPDMLLRGARSFSWLDRVAVALGPATPPEALALLRDDGNRLVRAAARSRA